MSGNTWHIQAGGLKLRGENICLDEVQPETGKVPEKEMWEDQVNGLNNED
jgi:hypothetical protein